MEERARDMHLVPAPGGERLAPPVGRPDLSAGDLDAARELAELHRLLAADLAPSSQIRGLVLRCAGHWSRLGAIPRNGLAGVESRDRNQSS